MARERQHFNAAERLSGILASKDVVMRMSSRRNVKISVGVKSYGDDEDDEYYPSLAPAPETDPKHLLADIENSLVKLKLFEVGAKHLVMNHVPGYYADSENNYISINKKGLLLLQTQGVNVNAGKALNNKAVTEVDIARINIAGTLAKVEKEYDPISSDFNETNDFSSHIELLSFKIPRQLTLAMDLKKLGMQPVIGDRNSTLSKMPSFLVLTANENMNEVYIGKAGINYLYGKGIDVAKGELFTGQDILKEKYGHLKRARTTFADKLTSGYEEIFTRLDRMQSRDR